VHLLVRKTLKWFKSRNFSNKSSKRLKNAISYTASYHIINIFHVIKLEKCYNSATIFHLGYLSFFFVMQFPHSPYKIPYYHSFKLNQQDATLYNILYYCQCTTCFRRFLRQSSGAQNCTHSIWYMSSLLAATASSKSPTLAVAASKLDTYQMLCVQFWSPDDGRRNRLKHVQHWQ
jgi:hypothetical protein